MYITVRGGKRRREGEQEGGEQTEEGTKGEAQRVQSESSNLAQARQRTLEEEKLAGNESS